MRVDWSRLWLMGVSGSGRESMAVDESEFGA